MDVAGSLVQKFSAELIIIQLMPNLQEAYSAEYLSLFLPSRLCAFVGNSVFDATAFV